MAQFPDELHGAEGNGVPVSKDAIEKILFGLGLCDVPLQMALSEKDDDAIPVIEFLQTSTPSNLENMVLILRDPTNHAILPRKAHLDGLEVMDPEATDYSRIRWTDLSSRMPYILLLKKSQNQ